MGRHGPVFRLSSSQIGSHLQEGHGRARQRRRSGQSGLRLLERPQSAESKTSYLIAKLISIHWLRLLAIRAGSVEAGGRVYHAETAKGERALLRVRRRFHGCRRGQDARGALEFAIV